MLAIHALKSDADTRMPDQNLNAIMGGMLVMLFVIIGVALIIVICFLLTLYRALSRVSPQNRLMEPGLVWLALIPVSTSSGTSSSPSGCPVRFGMSSAIAARTMAAITADRWE